MADTQFSTSFQDISKGIFGEDRAEAGAGTRKGVATEQLEIDEAGILSFIEDALSSAQGLAQIFGAEQGAGLFGGSVATKETESLLAKIAGELAKVTGRKVATTDEETTSAQTAQSQGLKDQIGGSGAETAVRVLTAPITGGGSLF